MLDLYSHAEFVYPCCASNFTDEVQRRKAASSILSSFPQNAVLLIP
jgi:hypothetical protein